MKEVLTVVRCTCDACKEEVPADGFEHESTQAGRHVGLCPECVERGAAIYARLLPAPAGIQMTVATLAEPPADEPGLDPWFRVMFTA